MPHRTKHPHGALCFVDVAVKDLDAAKHFYSNLFGWTETKLPIDVPQAFNDVVDTSMMQLEGKDVAEIAPPLDIPLPFFVAPKWYTYVDVASCDDATAIAAKQGATV